MNDFLNKAQKLESLSEIKRKKIKEENKEYSSKDSDDNPWKRM